MRKRLFIRFIIVLSIMIITSCSDTTEPDDALPPGTIIFVEGGTFEMGDSLDEGDNDEMPIHTVTINSFYIGKYEVTQAEYEEVMGYNPSYFDGGNKPIDIVSWYDALIYCNKKSILQGLVPCYSVNGDTNPDNWGENFNPNCNWNANGFRLPTEAEWEYSARGGINWSDNYRFCGTSDNLLDYAWYYVNSDDQTHEVGTKLPNQLGIHDMNGNVREWCWDWYSEDYYSSSSNNNPLGPDNGVYRVLRGWGYRNHTYNDLRVANRERFDPIYGGYTNWGFRIVRSHTD